MHLLAHPSPDWPPLPTPINGYRTLSLVIPAGQPPALAQKVNCQPCGDVVHRVDVGPDFIRLVVADFEGHGPAVDKRYHDHLERCLGAAAHLSPKEWLGQLQAEWPGERFASVLLLEIDTRRHEFITLGAGHPAPILRLPDRAVRRLQTSQLGLVGIDRATNGLHLPIHTFSPGQWVVCFTDGLLDAGVSRGEPFGADRLLRAIRSAPSPATAAMHILQRVSAHLNGYPLEDDLSLAVAWRSEASAAVQATPGHAVAAETVPVAPERDRWTSLLVAWQQSGDLAARDTLLTELVPVLRRRLQCILKDGHDVEDAVQETVLRIHLGLQSFNADRGDAKAWINSIAYHHVWDSQRKGQRWRRVKGEVAEAVQRRSGLTDPAQVFEAKEQQEAVRRALKELEPKQQEAIRLRYYEEMSGAAMAESCGCPASTVATHIHRGLQKLRGKLQGVRPPNGRIRKAA